MFTGLKNYLLKQILLKRGKLLLNMYRGGGSFSITVINFAYFMERGIDVSLDRKLGLTSSKTIFSTLDKRAIKNYLSGNLGLLLEGRMIPENSMLQGVNCRVVITLRNPVDQMSSYAYFLLTHAGQDKKSAIASANKYALQFYSRLDELRKGQILILRLEDIDKQPLTFFSELLNHLDLAIDLAYVEKALNICHPKILRKAYAGEPEHPRFSSGTKKNIFSESDFETTIQAIRNSAISSYYNL